MKEIVPASILFAVSIFLFFMSVRSFMEKGFLFNNAYIYASKQEREKMNKKPHYRQSAIVFLLIGLVVGGIALLISLPFVNKFSEKKDLEFELLLNRGTSFRIIDGGERTTKVYKYSVKTRRFEYVDEKEKFIILGVV